VSDSDELAAVLAGFEGQEAGPSFDAPDPVNQAMIRHWAEAMGDTNPVYVDEKAARDVGFPGVVAPPTMLQAWVMSGLAATLELQAARAAGNPPTENPQEKLMALLDTAGFTSVVATNCEQEYLRPLVLGDRLSVRSVIESVSPEKKTGLGAGHFVTNRMDVSDQDGKLVATMRFRILKFRPPAQPAAPDAGSALPREAEAPAPRRPRPAISRDIAFFFEGAKEGKLLIQRCTSCGRLRHPPLPACGACRSFEWDTVESSGRGTIFSFVVVHYPRVPGFTYPLAIALVELEEGTRIVANVEGIDPSEVRVGLPVVAKLVAFDDDLTLPVFYPAADSAAPEGTGATAVDATVGAEGGQA
jgi:uncharacterized OB-fold protein/acyl dehydratase